MVISPSNHIYCRGDSNRSPQHVILWRTSGNYAKSSFYSGLLERFHGYGGVHVMRVCIRHRLGINLPTIGRYVGRLSAGFM